MRRPYRERLRIILDELGAGVGGRASDIQATRPPRRAGAARDRRGAGDPRRPEQDAGQPHARRRRGDRRPRGQPQERRPLRHRDAPDRRAPRPSGATQIARQPAAPAGVPARARADDGQARPGDRRAVARRWPTSTQSSGQLATLLENLPDFADASRTGFKSLAELSRDGRPALRSARPTIDRADAGSPRTRPSWRTTSRSSSRTSTTASARSRRTRARRAARATRASRRSCSTSTTSRWPSTPSTPTATC